MPERGSGLPRRARSLGMRAWQVPFGRFRRPTATVGLAALVAGLVLAVGAVLLVASYWLLAVRLPGQFQAPEYIVPQSVVPASTGDARPDSDPTAAGSFEVLNPPGPADPSDPPSAPVALPRAKAAVATLVETAVQRSTQRLQAEYRSAYLRWSLPLLAGLTVASIAAGWAAARRALRPVAAITSRAHRLSEDTIEHRMPVGGPRELRELAQTLNGMLDRLESALTRERRLMANVSHELRTPIANQRMALAVALADPDADASTLRASARTALTQNRRTSHLIEQILLLAQVDVLGTGPAARSRPPDDQQSPGDPDHPLSRTDPVDLAHVVRDAIRAQEAQGTEPVRADLALAPAPALGDAILLERLAANLIDNAQRYNAPQDWVRIRTFVADGRAMLVVENPGPRIAVDQVHELLEPFRRGSHLTRRDVPDRLPGVGLGLSIVAAIVRVHHGDLSLEPRPEGGLTVQVRLPRVSVSSSTDPEGRAMPR